jgi:hypothetical protein
MVTIYLFFGLVILAVAYALLRLKYEQSEEETYRDAQPLMFDSYDPLALEEKFVPPEVMPPAAQPPLVTYPESAHPDHFDIWDWEVTTAPVEVAKKPESVAVVKKPAKPRVKKPAKVEETTWPFPMNKPDSTDGKNTAENVPAPAPIVPLPLRIKMPDAVAPVKKPVVKKQRKPKAKKPTV